MSLPYIRPHEGQRPIRILFVCLGNICRSPMAECVFRNLVEERGLGARFEIDSAGLIAHHRGEQADARMRAHAIRRGYSITSISRPIAYEDFFYYDYIVGMDEQNRQELLERAPTDDAVLKVSLLPEWHLAPLLDYVPDPYYGGAEGFEQVIDLVEQCTQSMLDALISDNTQA